MFNNNDGPFLVEDATINLSIDAIFQLTCPLIRPLLKSIGREEKLYLFNNKFTF